MKTHNELKQELEELVVEIDKAEKRLKSLRRPPADLSKGRLGPSFFATRESMARAKEAMEELEELKRRELEIRESLCSLSKEDGSGTRSNEFESPSHVPSSHDAEDETSSG